MSVRATSEVLVLEPPDSVLGGSVASVPTVDDHVHGVRSVVQDMQVAPRGEGPATRSQVAAGDAAVAAEMAALRAQLRPHREELQRRARNPAAALAQLPVVAWHFAFVSSLDAACSAMGVDTAALFPPSARAAASAPACQQRLLHAVQDVGRFCGAQVHGGGGGGGGGDGDGDGSISQHFEQVLATAAAVQPVADAVWKWVRTLGALLDAEVSTLAQHQHAVFSSNERALRAFMVVGTAAAQRARQQHAALRRRERDAGARIEAITTQQADASAAAARVADHEVAALAAAPSSAAASVATSLAAERQQRNALRDSDRLHEQLQALAARQLELAEARNGVLAQLGNVDNPAAAAAAEAQVSKFTQGIEAVHAQIAALQARRFTLDKQVRGHGRRGVWEPEGGVRGGSGSGGGGDEDQPPPKEAVRAAQSAAVLDTFRTAMRGKMEAEVSDARAAIVTELLQLLTRHKRRLRRQACDHAAAQDRALLARQARQRSLKAALLRNLTVVGGGAWRDRMLRFAQARTSAALARRVAQHVQFLTALFESPQAPQAQ